MTCSLCCCVIRRVGRRSRKETLSQSREANIRSLHGRHGAQEESFVWFSRIFSRFSSPLAVADSQNKNRTEIDHHTEQFFHLVVFILCMPGWCVITFFFFACNTKYSACFTLVHCFVLLCKFRTCNNDFKQEAITDTFPVSQLETKMKSHDRDSPLHWLVFLSRMAFVDTIFPYLQKTKRKQPLTINTHTHTVCLYNQWNSTQSFPQPFIATAMSALLCQLWQRSAAAAKTLCKTY